jgi:hypothetical protein
MTIAEIEDLDLSYTPPLGSPFDAVQLATQQWIRDHLPKTARSASIDGAPSTSPG